MVHPDVLGGPCGYDPSHEGETPQEQDDLAGRPAEDSDERDSDGARETEGNTATMEELVAEPSDPGDPEARREEGLENQRLFLVSQGPKPLKSRFSASATAVC